MSVSSAQQLLCRFAAGAFLAASCAVGHAQAAEAFCPNGSDPDPNVIWCDSFEQDDYGPKGTIGEKYFEFNTAGGDFGITTKEAALGKQALFARWSKGQVNAGHFWLNFGRNPLRSQLHTQRDFREIYWRFYVKLQDGFVGFPDKLTRITSFANSNWAQSMIAHIWHDYTERAYLNIDPASGIGSNGLLKTTKYNDFANLSWLGARQASTAMRPGQWYCVEGHVKLNTPSAANGIFEVWMDNKLEARRADLNFVHTWTNYGLNGLSFENYWNAGALAEQERYLDALVVSTNRIGCLGSAPKPPVLLDVQ